MSWDHQQTIHINFILMLRPNNRKLVMNNDKIYTQNYNSIFNLLSFLINKKKSNVRPWSRYDRHRMIVTAPQYNRFFTTLYFRSCNWQIAFVLMCVCLWVFAVISPHRLLGSWNSAWMILMGVPREKFFIFVKLSIFYFKALYQYLFKFRKMKFCLKYGY